MQMESTTRGSPPSTISDTSNFSLPRASAAIFVLFVFGIIWNNFKLQSSFSGKKFEVDTTSSYNKNDQVAQLSVSKVQNDDDDGEKNKYIGVIEELYQVVNAERLSKIAQHHRQAYAHAAPFPHIVIDGIFPRRFLEAVSGEFPQSEDENGCYAETCFSQSRQNKKSAVNDEHDMGLYTRVFFAFLKSSTWVRFLEELSGIHDIIPDPHYRGSGMHITASGGNLDIHADFNRYNQYELDRRINTFVYLNDDWPESYGGHLELWGRDMKSCYQKILPSMGRFVVFSSTDFTYHGHPQPQTSPKDRARRSIALYYFTNGRPAEECLNRKCDGNDHSTLFQKPVNCTVCEEDMCKRYNKTAPYWVGASWSPDSQLSTNNSTR